MPITIHGDQAENDIQLSSQFLSAGDGSITLNGTGASITAEDTLGRFSLYCTMSSGARISIGRNCVLGALSIHALAPGATIVIGAGVGFNGSVSVTAHEASRIEIGDGCLIASECSISSSDVHSIYDVTSGLRINHAADIIIGPRVWLAARVMVMKGVAIGGDTVVGAGSIVTHDQPGNCIVAGIPAREIRSGVRWEH